MSANCSIHGIDIRSVKEDDSSTSEGGFMSGKWNEIGSAPHGQRVFVKGPYFSEFDNGQITEVCISEFDVRTGNWEHEKGYYEFEAGCGVGNPTHWMPLPSVNDKEL